MYPQESQVSSKITAKIEGTHQPAEGWRHTRRQVAPIPPHFLRMKTLVISPTIQHESWKMMVSNKKNGKSPEIPGKPPHFQLQTLQILNRVFPSKTPLHPAPADCCFPHPTCQRWPQGYFSKKPCSPGTWIIPVLPKWPKSMAFLQVHQGDLYHLVTWTALTPPQNATKYPLIPLKIHCLNMKFPFLKWSL